MYVSVYGVRIVNKAFEVEISDPSEGPLLPLYRPARLRSSSEQHMLTNIHNSERSNKKPIIHSWDNFRKFQRPNKSCCNKISVNFVNLIKLETIDEVRR